MGHAMQCENLSYGICGERRPRSACASAQSDQGLHCPLTESLDTTECINGEQRLGRYFVHAQDDLNLHIFCACSKALFRLTRSILLDINHCTPLINLYVILCHYSLQDKTPYFATIHTKEFLENPRTRPEFINFIKHLRSSHFYEPGVRKTL